MPNVDDLPVSGTVGLTVVRKRGRMDDDPGRFALLIDGLDPDGALQIDLEPGDEMALAAGRAEKRGRTFFVIDGE
jgi:hypothetical protein